MTNSSLSDAIKHKAKEIGFSKVGITAAVSGPETQHLQTWLDHGYMADMAWMANPKRQDISQVMPDVRSVICVALNYYTPHHHIHDPEIGKISRYGWGRDYHKVLTKKLKLLSQWLINQPVPDGITAITSRYYVDTGPIAEKALAQRAGIGWIGKHSNIISREFGSWLFLGEILTNLELAYDTPHADHCGTCTRCLTACPTQAIVKPFVVDANRCLAYHTIENRAATLPPEITAAQNNWVAGCDICQDVCPWNQRFAQETPIADFQPFPENLAPSLADLAQMDETTWDQRFTGSALRRIKPHQWRRNATNHPSP